MDKFDFIIVERDKFIRLGCLLRDIAELGFIFTPEDMCEIIRSSYADISWLSLGFYDKHPDSIKSLARKHS